MRDYPLIKFVLAFCIGLVTTSFFNPSFTFLLILFILTLVVSILTFRNDHDIVKVIHTIAVFCTIAFIGMLYIKSYELDKPEYPFKERFIRDVLVDGRVEEIELPSDNLQLTLKVKKVFKNNEIIESDFLLLCNLRYDPKEINEILKILRPGNRITILGSISIPPNQRNPGEFDYRKYLSGEGISAILSSYSAMDFVIIDYDEDIISSAIFSTRYAIANQIKEIYTPQTTGLLKGLLLADRSEIGYDVKEGFIKSGVIHVLAVSGLHVGFIVLILLFFFGRLNIYLRIAFTIIGLLGFMVITGLSPSVTRATIMAILLLISYIRSNKQNNFNTLSLAALFILFVDPTQIFNPGFQLSFSAVISIFIFFPRFKNIVDTYFPKNKYVKFILLFLSVSLSAQLGTIPFTVYYFNKLSLISLVSNLIVIPAIGIILGVGILSIIISSFYVHAASLFVLFNEGLVEFIYWLVTQLSSFGLSYLSFSNYTIWDGAIFLILLSLFTFYFKKMASIKSKIIFSILLIGNLFVWSKVDDRNILPPGKLSILFTDVGQSESAIIKFSDSKTAIINFGGATPNYSMGSATIIPLLNKLGITKIDYGIITHLNRDKYLGSLELLERNLIDTLIIPKIYGMGAEDSLFYNYLMREKIAFKNVTKEKVIRKDSRIYFLSDDLNSECNYFEIMNKSLPLKIQYGKTSILFTGGIEKRGEEILIEGYNKLLKSDILCIANYGSNVSSSMEFLKQVNPKYSVISVGLGNFMEYPSEEVIEFNQQINSQVIRTDEEGAILFVSDGNTIQRKNWRVY